jgi:hypothetical protein
VSRVEVEVRGIPQLLLPMSSVRVVPLALIIGALDGGVSVPYLGHGVHRDPLFIWILGLGSEEVRVILRTEGPSYAILF